MFKKVLFQLLNFSDCFSTDVFLSLYFFRLKVSVSRFFYYQLFNCLKKGPKYINFGPERSGLVTLNSKMKKIVENTVFNPLFTLIWMQSLEFACYLNCLIKEIQSICNKILGANFEFRLERMERLWMKRIDVWNT